MTVSLFTLTVARGAEVPVIDPRLLAHVSHLEGVNQDQGSAAQADASSQANTEPVSESQEGNSDAMAPSGNGNDLA